MPAAAEYSKVTITFLGGVDKVIPVSAYIPGCPPRPEAIIDGCVKLLNAINPPKVKKQKQIEAPKEEPKTEVAQPMATPVVAEVKQDGKQ